MSFFEKTLNIANFCEKIVNNMVLPHHPPVHDPPDSDQSGEVVEQKHAQVVHHLMGIGIGVQLVADHAGHGGDQGAQPAYVNPQQQFPGVAGETGQQHGGRHVADKLAGHDAGQVYDTPGMVQVLVQLPDGIPVGQVADKDEKADKGQQQGVVRLFQQAAVHRGYHGHYGGGTHKGAYYVQHRKEAQQQQAGKDKDPGARAGFRFAVFQLQSAVGQSVHQNGQPQSAQYRQRPQHGKKVAGGQLVMVIDEQVLWVPHRGAGTAQIGSQCLEYHDPPYVQFQLFAGDQGQGYKNQQGDVIGDKHGCEKWKPDQYGRHVPCGAAVHKQEAGGFFQHEDRCGKR